MFKNVLNTVFDSSAASGETTPAPEPIQLQNDEVSLLDDTVMNSHDTAFLNYLFGETTSMAEAETDPFSDYVSEQLERILIAPTQYSANCR
ncbi:hypothetical protein B6A42_21420 [Vibrio coralliilyticus]|nr:hypothetical protein B6A42_21420 [Vibrio coralliilyticus]